MNKNKDDISKIKAKIRYLDRQRQNCEKYLLARHKMINGSLIIKSRLAHGKIRKTSAYYLSRKINDKTRCIYVKDKDLDIVKRRATSWKYYSHNLSKHVKISKEIETLFRKLGVLSLDIPDRYKINGYRPKSI